jgi:hypothetical protein
MNKRRIRPSRATARAACTVTAAVALALALGGGASAATTFLDDVDRGKAAVASSGAASLTGTAARAAAVSEAAAKDGKPSPAFTIGTILAALNLDLEKPTEHLAGDRAVVEQQVRDLLAAQAESKIGNRALCLLSGRDNPRSLEAQIRLVVPNWTCGPTNHH